MTGPGAAVTLGHGQGFLCSATAAGLQVPACAKEHISQTRATIPIRTFQDGSLRLTAIMRSFDYQEYFVPTLTCNAAPSGWTHVSDTDVTQPPWFVPLMNENRQALRMEFVAPASGNMFCDVVVSFDLRSPPYSPYDVTVVLEPQ